MLRLRLLGAIELASGDAPAASSILTQPKRIAILAYLALATPRGFHRRDKLLALFWPDSEDAHARRALNQALYQLRQVLGEDAILTRGDGEVGLNWDQWWCDATELRAAAAAERYDNVLQLYRGPLLDAFHATASVEFDQWLDSERAAARSCARLATIELAARAVALKDYESAIACLRRAVELEPLDEEISRRLIEVLHRTGDKRGALAEYDRITGRLAFDLEAAPSPELTALADSIRHAPANGTPPTPGRKRWYARRRQLIGGAVAVVAVGVVAWAFVAARRSSTLFGSGALAERDLLLIADFTNTTRDTTLGPVVTELMRVDLEQSRSIKVLPPAAVREALVRMLRDTVRVVSGDVAREVAIREGAKAVVEGDIADLGSGYVLTARVTAAETGEVLVSFRELARDADALIDAVESLSHHARAGIGEKLRTIRATQPLERTTTASLPALRAYVAAQRANRRGDQAEVTAQLEAALALDSTFVAAHRWLGNGAFNTFRADRKAVEHLTIAYNLASRLPEYERLITEGTYHKHVSGDSMKAIAAFERAHEMASQPFQRAAAAENLGVLYVWHGDLARAEQMWQERADHRAMVPRANITPLGWGYVFNQLLEVQLAAGRIDAADRTARTAESYFGRWFGAAKVANARQDFDSAEVVLRKIPNDAYAQLQLNDVLFLRGRLHEADALPFAQRLRWYDELLRTFFDLLVFEDPDAAVRRVDAMVARDSLETTPSLAKPRYVQLVAFYAYAGRLNRARHWYDKVQAVRNKPQLAHAIPIQYYGDEFMRGMIAFGEKKYDEALPHLRAAADNYHRCRTCLLVELGLAYQAVGQLDSAIAVLERHSVGPQMGIDGFNATASIPFAHMRLGELYEAKRDYANAARHYAALIELWKKADPELRPFVAKATAGLTRIRSYSGRT